MQGCSVRFFGSKGLSKCGKVANPQTVQRVRCAILEKGPLGFPNRLNLRGQDTYHVACSRIGTTQQQGQQQQEQQNGGLRPPSSMSMKHTNTTRMHAHVHTHTCTRTCTCIRTHTHTRTRAYAHARTHKHAHTHTNTHIQTHTYGGHHRWDKVLIEERVGTASLSPKLSG
jgi:hypothetical protein